MYIISHHITTHTTQNLLFLFEMMSLKSSLLSTGLLSADEIGVFYAIGVEERDRERMMDRERVSRKGDGSLNENEFAFDRQIQFIVDQYIRSDGMFVLNLSYRDRKAIVEGVGGDGDNDNGDTKQHLIDTLHLMDSAVKTSFMLMRDSFSRFAMTGEYKVFACQK